MATRTCGKVKIQCAYRDASDDYRCTLSVGGKKRGVQYVGRAPVSARTLGGGFASGLR